MTQSKDYDFLVFIGRFQPFHQGHFSVIQKALELSEQVIILCGSAHQPRSARNPWSFKEREAMISTSIPVSDKEKVHVAPLMDILYNDETWVRNVQTTVNGIVTAHHRAPHKLPKIGLIGHSKDHSSYYLNLFPQWGAVNVSNYKALNSTDIRESYFKHTDKRSFIQSAIQDRLITDQVAKYLNDYSTNENYAQVKDEFEFVEKYKKAWNTAPYPPTFVTVDALVVQSGHVLMVERKARPGKGLLALPGGFLNQNERLLDACLRELREETRLKVPAPVLKGSIKAQEVFDEPHRSTRGRTITHAFHIELEANKSLPKVKGSDDAKHAMWVPLSELDPRNIFEDHYFIIQSLLGLQ